MKKIIITCIVFIVSMSFVSTNNCDTNKYKPICLSKLGEGYTYIKSYSLEKKGDEKLEYSFVFSKNVNYMITTATDIDEEPRVEIKVYDKYRKLLFSNYHKRKDRFHIINYPCIYTGVHYITFKHHNEEATCGLSVLAFKR